ncbi:hypothetical protein HY572_00385 [Candidatus Micrarchaeota archaeon]|nr:hypothetical protein [Candidatus Micrarchaeota archaeon]
MNGPPSRGIATKKALLFEYGKLPMSLNARWEVEDVLKIVFPPALQKVQYDVAVRLVKHLLLEGEMDGRAISKWQAEAAVANSTLRNLVIPKLVRTGLLARERRSPTGQDDKDKRHKMVIKPSLRFGQALQHVGREWNSLVETARIKRDQKDEVA